MNIREKLSERTLSVLSTINNQIIGTPFEGRLYIIGGIVRDAIMGLPDGQDVDIVCDCDIEALVTLLTEVSTSEPIVYPRYGTALLMFKSSDDSYLKVELVAPRKESYTEDTRKPNVVPGTLMDDVLRRDFTINTLMANIVTLDVDDLTGCGLHDIANQYLNTPVDPNITFFDDPLRILRAIRFIIKYDMDVDQTVEAYMTKNASRLSILSMDRVRDELVKIFSIDPYYALYALNDYGILQHTPLRCLCDGIGMVQSKYHIYDVFGHIRNAIHRAKNLGDIYIPGGAPDSLIWAAILHDVGKPYTRTKDPVKENTYHFYGHEDVSTELTKHILEELKFSTVFINKVSKMVSMHMRSPEPKWNDRAYRRLAVAAGDDLQELLLLMKADGAAGNPEYDIIDLEEVQAKIDSSMSLIDMTKDFSPLSGGDIMNALHITPGKLVGDIKTYLSDLVIAGDLSQIDTEGAKREMISYLRSVDTNVDDKEILCQSKS